MKDKEKSIGNQTLLEHGSFARLVVSLSVPAIVIMLVMVIYNMADVYFISQTKDADKIAAVSLCAPLFSILSGLGTLFGSGGCTSISLALGRQQMDRAKNITALCFWGSLLIGAGFLCVVMLFLEPVCLLLGADASTLGYTMDYLRIIAIGAPVILFSNVFMNLIRADGAAAVSMVANVIGTLINLVLDPLFILALGLGAAGAAIATVLGNVASAAALVWYCTQKCTYCSFRPGDISLRPEISLPVVTLGLPTAFSTILMSVSHVFANNMMMEYGTAAMSAQSVAGRISTVITMTAMGLCMGMQPAISFNYARKNRKRTAEVLLKTALTAVCLGSVLTVVCFVMREPLVMAFLKGLDDPNAVSLSISMLNATLVIGPLAGILQLCTTYLQSTGKAVFATIASLMNKGIIYLPVLFTLHGLFQLNGLIWTNTVTEIIYIPLSLGLCVLSERFAARKEQAGGEAGAGAANESNPAAGTGTSVAKSGWAS